MKLYSYLKTPDSVSKGVLLVILFLTLIHDYSRGQSCVDTSLRRSYSAQFGLSIRSQLTLNDGNILINAFKINPFTQKIQTTIIKLYNNGDIIWSNNLETGNGSIIEIQQLLELESNGYVIAGRLTGNNDDKIFLAKLDLSGSIMWQRSFSLNSPSLNTPDFKGFYALAEDPVSGKIFASLQVSTNLNGGSTFDVNVVAGFNSNGINLWAKYLFHNDIEPYTNFSGLEVINNSVIAIAESAMFFPGVTEVSPSFIFTKLNIDTGVPDLVRCYKVMPDPLDSTTFVGSYLNAPLHSQASIKTKNDEIIYFGAPIYNTLKNGMYIRFDSSGNFKTGRNLFQSTNSHLYYLPFTQVYATPEGRFITLVSSRNFLDTYLTVYDSSFRIEQQQKISALFFNHNNSCLFKNITVNEFETEINLLHNYAQPNGMGGLINHFELQKFFSGQSANTTCFGTEGLAELLTNMDVEEYPFSYQSIHDISFSETITNASLVSQSINSSLTCSYNSTCDSISIIDTPIICHLNREYEFKATKGSNCNKRVLWSFLPAANNIIEQLNDSVIRVSFRQDWQGQVIASLSGDCNISDTINFSLQLSPDSVFLGDDLNLCLPISQVLDAGSYFKSYTWNDGSNLQHLTVTGPGTYWVSAENFCGEFYRDTIVIAGSQYSLDISPTEEKCNFDTVDISRNPAFQNFSVSPNNSFSISANTISFWPITTTTYTINAQSPDGCILQDTVRILVKNSPPIYLGTDTGFCVGDSVFIDAGNMFNNYQWHDGFSGSQRWISQSGTYSAAATFNNGCISKDTIVIQPPTALPIVNLPEIGTVCIGQNNTLIAPDGYDSYLWQDGSTASTFEVNSPGFYNVRVTNQGCSNSDTVEIAKVSSGVSGFLPGDTTVCYSDKISICSQIANNNYTYLWSNNSTGFCIQVEQPGTYSLQITNNDGCISKEIVEVKDKDCAGDIFFPNVFTPNSDNLNDIYKPKSFVRLATYKLIIYNRWGQLIFHSNEINKGWDGKFAGVKQEQGVYTWTCEYTFPNSQKTIIKKGTLILIR